MSQQRAARLDGQTGHGLELACGNDAGQGEGNRTSEKEPKCEVRLGDKMKKKKSEKKISSSLVAPKNQPANAQIFPCQLCDPTER